MRRPSASNPRRPPPLNPVRQNPTSRSTTALSAGGDDPHINLTGGAEEEEPSRRSNGPPDDFTRLEDVFPGLSELPAWQFPWRP